MSPSIDAVTAERVSVSRARDAFRESARGG
jgi:hypothetical protein